MNQNACEMLVSNSATRIKSQSHPAMSGFVAKVRTKIVEVSQKHLTPKKKMLSDLEPVELV